MVDLVRSRCSPEALAKEFPLKTIRNWFRRHDLDQGRRTDGLTTGEWAELPRPRCDNRQFRVQPEILAIATAWLVRQTETRPSLLVN